MHMMLAICAIGLVAHKTIPWAAASCDGIALVRWPSTGDHVVCSVEFKTCVAPGTLEQAFAVREHLGELIVVENVGDPRWFESITEDHRAQVLHQMFVSGLKHFVYVRASMTDIIYCVLGRASDDAIDRFGRAVLSVGESLLSWAHPTGDTSEVVIPNWIDESDKRLLQSHLPFGEWFKSTSTETVLWFLSRRSSTPLRSCTAGSKAASIRPHSTSIKFDIQSRSLDLRPNT